MTKASPITISVSRQFGSGGGIIGSNLAKKLGFQYMDREIVMEAAKKLGVSYREIESCDERNASFWKSVLYSFQYGDYTFSAAEHVPSDLEIHRVESEIVLEAAKHQSVVIVGRGANFVLKDVPNHVSLFFHADESSRSERIQAMFRMNPQDALKMMHQTDHSRESYIQRFTGHSLYDLRHYDLAIDTGALPLDKAETLVLSYLAQRFGEPLIRGLLDRKAGHDGRG